MRIQRRRRDNRVAQRDTFLVLPAKRWVAVPEEKRRAPEGRHIHILQPAGSPALISPSTKQSCRTSGARIYIYRYPRRCRGLPCGRASGAWLAANSDMRHSAIIFLDMLATII